MESLPVSGWLLATSMLTKSSRTQEGLKRQHKCSRKVHTYALVFVPEVDGCHWLILRKLQAFLEKTKHTFGACSILLKVFCRIDQKELLLFLLFLRQPFQWSKFWSLFCFFLLHHHHNSNFLYQSYQINTLAISSNLNKFAHWGTQFNNIQVPWQQRIRWSQVWLFYKLLLRQKAQDRTTITRVWSNQILNHPVGNVLELDNDKQIYMIFEENCYNNLYDYIVICCSTISVPILTNNSWNVQKPNLNECNQLKYILYWMKKSIKGQDVEFLEHISLRCNDFNEVRTNHLTSRPVSIAFPKPPF